MVVEVVDVVDSVIIVVVVVFKVGVRVVGDENRYKSREVGGQKLCRKPS